MILTRQRDNILVQGATGRDRLFLGKLIWPYSNYAKGFVIPEWAFGGLPEKFQQLPIQGSPAPLPAEKRCNPFDLSYLPPNLTLYEFQKPLALNMTAGRYGLWADAGVGKTVTTLAAYKMLRAQGLIDGMIVIGPENGRHVWCGPYSESARWIDEPGHYVESGGQLEPPKTGIIYTTAAKVFLAPYHTWLGQRLQSGRFVLCVDEAHMCSGAFSKRFAAIKAWAMYCRWVWLLSATPTSNYPDTFWSMYCLLTGSNVAVDTWVDWFRVGKTEGSKSKWYEGRLKALGEYLGWCTKTVRKDVVAPYLPPVTEQVMRIPLVGKQRKHYRALLDDMRSTEGTVGSQVQAGSKNWQHKLQYLVSMASHPLISGEKDWTDADIGKLDALETIVGSAYGQKICVWSWHPKVLDWIATKLGPEQCVVYHGEISKTKKTEAVHRFNKDPQIRFFLGNPSAAGTSLNLGEGTVRIFWDLGWSYVQYHQACERINRITRTKPITGYVLIGENTVEEMMWRSIQRKEELASYITSEKRNTSYEREVLALWKS